LPENVSSLSAPPLANSSSQIPQRRSGAENPPFWSNNLTELRSTDPQERLTTLLTGKALIITRPALKVQDFQSRAGPIAVHRPDHRPFTIAMAN
jgi:hypothetical protein